MFKEYSSLIEFNETHQQMTSMGFTVDSWQYYPTGAPVLVVFWILN